MKTLLFRPALVALSVLEFSGASAAQNAPRPQTPTEIVAPVIPGVIAPGTKIQLVKGGFRRTEGPVGTPDGSILFTDAGTITKIDAREIGRASCRERV